MARLSLHDNGMKLPDDKKASTLKKLPDIKKVSLPKDVDEDCEENNYAKEALAGLPIIQKMVTMEADDYLEESKSDEEAIAEAYRNMKTSTFVPYCLEWREER